MDLVELRGSFNCVGVVFAYMCTVQTYKCISAIHESLSPFQPTVSSLKRILVMFISHCIIMQNIFIALCYFKYKEKNDSVEAHCWLCVNKRLHGFSDTAACLM